MRRVIVSVVSLLVLFGALAGVMLWNGTCLFGHEYRNEMCKRCGRVRPDSIGIWYQETVRGDGTHTFCGTVYNGKKRAVDSLKLQVCLLDGPMTVKTETALITRPDEVIAAGASASFAITVKTRGISFDSFRIGVAEYRD